MGTTDTAKPRCAFSKGQKVIIPSGEARFVCWYNEDGTRIGVGKVPEQRGDLEFLASRDLKPSPLPVPPVALPQSDRKVHDGAFDYQVTGVRWLDAVKAGLLADEPGLGKTFQACGAADARVIVVCPAAMRVEWQLALCKLAFTTRFAWTPPSGNLLLRWETTVAVAQGPTMSVGSWVWARPPAFRGGWFSDAHSREVGRGGSGGDT